MSKGYAIKSIAREKSTVPRTVETYINRIKEKTGLYYKTDLLKSWNSDFLFGYSDDKYSK